MQMREHRPRAPAAFGSLLLALLALAAVLGGTATQSAAAPSADVGGRGPRRLRGRSRRFCGADHRAGRRARSPDGEVGSVRHDALERDASRRADPARHG